MSVAFVMGAAFTKLSGSFIEDLVMPFVGRISGGVDFSNKFVPLYGVIEKTVNGVKTSIDPANIGTLAEAKSHGAVFAYGNFITIGINFVIVAFVMFLVVKAINKLKRAEAAAPAAPPAPTAQEVLLGEIRDLLKQKN